MSLFNRFINTLRLLVILSLTFSLSLAGYNPPLAGATGSETAEAAMPFEGRWARSISGHPNDCTQYGTHPSCHDIHQSGADWSTDVYAVDGTEVRANFANPTGNLSLRVEYVGSISNCSAGKVIRVRVKVDNVDLGWIQYVHVNTPWANGHTQDISNGTLLGTTKFWSYDADCWQVSTSSGVHVHLESGNTPATEKACYVSLTSGSTYSASTIISRVGNTGVTTSRTECPVVTTVSPGVGTRLVGDVTGDGKADSVVKFRDSGSAYVAPSTGGSFSTPPQHWAFQQTIGADKYFLGDVNGDGKEDLAAYWASIGQWYISLSDINGNGFWTETHWASGQGVGSHKQFLADVTGDEKADLVLFWKSSGTWYVLPSNGTTFDPPQLWSNGHGADSTDQVVADFNGDLKADFGFYYIQNGSWYVIYTNTTPPLGAVQRSAGHGTYSNQRLVGDISGDGKADACYFTADVGYWDCGIMAPDNGGYLWPVRWGESHGVNSNERFLADVTGEGKADEVLFFQSVGAWQVGTSVGTAFNTPTEWITNHGKGS
jgi:hypothetical protein